MYHITLTQEQYDALLDLLQCAIPELHSEIIHTDDHCLRETLKERRQSLVSVINLLQAQPPAEKNA